MQKNNKALIIIVFLFSFTNSFTQTSRLTRTQINDSILKMPRFSGHKNTYFITGIPTNTSINKSNSDIKYQISFKQLLTRNTLIWDTYLFFTYSQKSFWNVYRESSPFAEINFNPSIGLGKVFYNKKDEVVAIGSFGLEHESNGRDSIFSRSWNNIHGVYNTKIGVNTALGIRAYIPFLHKESNPELMNYIGFGELTITHKFLKDNVEFELMVRKGAKWSSKGATRSRLYLRTAKKSNQYIMIEWFNGYSESLINYRDHTSMLRIGYVIKSSPLKLLGF